MDQSESTREQLVQMSRRVAAAEVGHVILGEGNTSALVDENTFLVKGSGERLATIGADGFVAVDLQRALALLEQEVADEQAQRKALADLKVDPEAPGRPSVEVLLHAVALEEGAARFIGHTHTISVTGLLCSPHARGFAHGRLFPDQIVLCGPDSVLVPYVSPGLPLGRAVHTAIRDFKQRYGVPPKTIMMENHGLVALGETAQEVEQILAMCAKAAQIYAVACAAGGPVLMTEAQIDEIYHRADEKYRRQKLVSA